MRTLRTGGAGLSQRLVLSLLGLAAAAAFGAGAGCGGATKGAPIVGGESHFLHWCSDGCDEAGLECISGLCTQPCVVAEPNACSAFTNAVCTSDSIEPGAVAVCDVRCDRDADCAAHGGDHGCFGGFCRAAEIVRSGAAESAGTGGTSTLGSSGGTGTAASGGDAGGTGRAASGGDAGGSSTAGLECEECLELDVLRWTVFSGESPPEGLPASELSTCNSYSHRMVRYGSSDGPPLPECAAPVDGCPSGDLAILSLMLQDPEIQAALESVTFFGRDLTAVGGAILEISYGIDSRFFVAAPCNGTSDGCIEIPPVIISLIEQLQVFDEVQLAKPSCAAAFPNGAGN